ALSTKARNSPRSRSSWCSTNRWSTGKKLVPSGRGPTRTHDTMWVPRERGWSKSVVAVHLGPWRWLAASRPLVQLANPCQTTAIGNRREQSRSAHKAFRWFTRNPNCRGGGFALPRVHVVGLKPEKGLRRGSTDPVPAQPFSRRQASPGRLRPRRDQRSGCSRRAARVRASGHLRPRHVDRGP